ncbi:protein-tyrosine phosphatase-like, PTPLA isoform X3 [Wolffia australiana]
MSPLVSFYLLAYNIAQFTGWAIALAKIFGSYVSTDSVHGAYNATGDLICILQLASFLEVLHAAVGFVPSGVLFSLMQWGGRTHFLLAIVRQIEEVQELPSVFITFLAWSISEVIRYFHFTLMGLGLKPRWLIYLRYTAFIVLYPAGVGPGEMWLMYQALPFIKEKALYSSTFAALPFTYHTFVLVVLLCYPFLWLKLYLHLFKQRKAKLSTSRRAKKE